MGIHCPVHVHVETPWERLGAQRGRHLGSPVLVRVASVQTIVKGRLHESIELSPKASLERLHVPLAFTPLGSSVLEPHLQHSATQTCNEQKEDCCRGSSNNNSNSNISARVTAVVVATKH